MADRSERLERLSPAKRRLLEKLLREQRPAGSIPRAALGGDTAPLSFAQERFWLLEQLEPGSPAHRIPSALRLRGKLDVAALARALTRIVERHESLRTTFELRTEGPVQVVRPAHAVELVLHPASERERLRESVVLDPFDLARGPLARFVLVKLGDDDHELLVCLHHIVADGLSTQVLGRELAALYGGAADLPELAIRPRDFAVWQRAQKFDAELAWWKEKLTGAADLELPTDHPRAAQWKRRGGRESVTLSREVAAKLAALARAEGATPAMAHLALMAGALHRWTGAADLVVGVPAANRTRGELAPLIGFFVNSLALRLDLAGDPSFRECLRRARAASVDAQARQDVPFEQVVEALHPQRRLDRNPLFQVMCNYVDFVGSRVELAGLEADVEVLQAGTLHDLTFYGWAAGGVLRLEIEHDAELFEAVTIRRLLARIELLLQGALDDPERPISKLPFLPADERALLAQWGNGGAATPIPLLAKQDPSALALRQGSERVPYGELRDAAGKIAAALRARGIGLGDRVGLLLERRPAMVKALLGVLASGAAAVPLDPRHPEARRALIREDARLSLVVDENVLEELATADSSAATSPPAAGDPAYVLYTSGSTGRPKGVVVSHGALAAHLGAMTRELELRPKDVWLAVTTLGFDIALLELLGPLASGGSILLATSEEASDGAALAALLAREPVTILQATPSMWRMLVDAGWEGTRGLKILSGGESLPRDLAAELLRRGASLRNLYGPTETTIWSTAHRVAGPPDGTTAPIGRPIAGTLVAVVDDRRGPAPLGAPGELLIGGAGVALGYFERPDLTAESFVDVDGARFYRTGDRVRWRADGALEFLGRGDAQVKLRGHRIELGEVESALRAHPGVRDAVVALREERLLAWVVPRASERADEAEAVGAWTKVWESAYAEEGEPRDPAFDLRGWKESATGRPMAEEAMREWVDASVARIEEMRPRHVLEVGCGTGLLLWRLAPRCEEWVALDPAANVVERVSAEAQRRGLSHVRVERRAAHELDGFEPERFDLILLNSVVQYFPSPAYLRRILASLAPLTAPGGRIFLGDLRSLLHGRADDEELLVDPRRVGALAPEGFRATAQLRRGRRHDELTRFRFDAVLERAPDDGVEPGERRYEGAMHAIDAPMRVTGIPNGRLVPGGVDPETLRTHAAELGLEAEVSFGEEAAQIEVLFRKPGTRVRARRFSAEGDATNDPSRGRLAAELRASLRARLPEAMVPSAIGLVDALPLTPSGKVDRRALATPGAAPVRSGSGRAPSTETERALAPLLRELLGVERVGADDGFFDLGGHSLLAARLLARVRALFGAEVALRSFFAAPTLAGLAAAVDAAAKPAPRAREPRPARPPLSFAQERLWFLDRMEPGSLEYVMAGAVRLRGPLRVELLARALTEVAARHEILRTRFPDEEGKPWQEVGAPAPVPLPVEEAGEEGALRRAQELAQLPFDLARGPLLRAHCLRIGPEEHILVLAQHHAISDAASLVLLGQELSAIYAARARGEAAALPSLAYQVAEVAVEERARASDDLPWWRETLAGAPPSLELPIDRARGPIRSSRGGRVRFRMAQALARALRERARAEGTTLFSLLLASFQALLQRWTLQEEMVVGTAVSGRRSVETERLLGLFVRTLPLRGRVDAAEPFRALLARATAGLRDALSHADVPFEKLVAELAPVRDPSRTPIFQVFFDLRSEAPATLDLPGIAAEEAELDLPIAKFDLSLSVEERADSLRAELEYAADLFERATIERLASWWMSLLEAAARDPEMPVGALPLGAAVESPPVPSLPSVEPLSGLTAPAISSVAAILASWKEGRPWIPIDPSWPEERRALVRRAIERSPPPASAAYVLFTSGSTGEPKGVVVGHESIARHARWFVERFRIGAADRFCLRTSLSFDASFCEILPALVAGASIVEAPQEARADPAALLELAAREGVTVLQVVPALLRGMAEAGALERCRALRLVICGGEALPAELASRFLRRAREAGLALELHNLYGPTEATIDATSHSCVEEECARARPGSSVPIGRPLPYATATVVDAAGKAVPAGVPGELRIGGGGLALGYLGDPRLTSERFLETESGRLYRTGDLARRREDGVLEFLGRADGQVKVRGVRLELGETESALAAHPDVAAAVVAATVDSLAAWVVPRPGKSVDAAALRSFLAERLPPASIPSRFVPIERVPLNSSGKVDRRALRLPRAAPIAPLLPRTPTEEALAAIWREVLGLEHVGVRDSFFELGGHSLLAAQVAARVRRTLGAELPLRTLFAAVTIEELAAETERLRGAPLLPALRRMPRPARIPLSFAQERLWFLHRLDPARDPYVMAAALRLRGELSVSALERAFTELTARHEALRTRFPEETGVPRQEIDPPSPIRIDVEDAPSLEEAERRAREEVRRPFDLARGPLLRVRLLRLGARDHLLVFAQHHVVSDGWSVGILVREIAALYADATARLPELPVQYADFAMAQREAFAGADLEGWKRALEGAPPALELPTDFERSAKPRHRGAVHRIRLEAELAHELRARARAEGTTLFTLLLSAFQALLHRWSGQDDLVVGTAVAGRRALETEGLIGLFVNALPLRSRIDEGTTFRALLGATRERTLDAFAAQDLPFEKLVDALRPRRQLDRAPIFQVGFDLASGVPPRPALSGLEVSEIALDPGTAKFDLSLLLEERGGTIEGALEYDVDLFRPETIERAAGWLRVLLASVAADPERDVASLPLGEGEVLVGPDAPAAETPIALFDRRAKESPDAIALVEGERSVSYGDLARRTEERARALRKEGVAPGVVVAVERERSIETVVEFLAIRRAGGVWLPIDPAWPAARREKIRRASEPVSPSAAYVLYTSGSTGEPKGVEVPDSALAHYAAWVRASLGVEPRDRFLLRTALTFDPSLLEIVPALTAGAVVVIAPPGAERDPALLLETVEAAGVTILVAIPSFLRLLADAPGLEKCRSLRHLLVGGEPFPRALAEKVHARLAVSIRNLYGPTEATIHATESVFVPGERPPGSTSGTVPIGRPLAGARAVVLDAARAPVPPGIPGELALGGAGLASGYRGRPDLTAERFFGEERLYRTGDRARLLADGRLEHLGRVDAQVKLRGVRIELGETQAALEGHPGVREAAAALRGDRLLAWIVPREGAAPSPEELRAFLAERLPAALVPAAFVRVASLPRAANGKVDRAALPDPGDDALPSATAAIEARTPLEKDLAAVWREVLGVERAGVRDSFFEVGGDSLRAVRLAARVSEACGVVLPVLRVFESPTIESLASVVEALRRGDVVEPRQRRTPAELREEARLDPAIRPPSKTPGRTRRIFLTGATGFLGGFLLRELLAKSDATIDCLVRGRLAPSPRVRPVLGSLGPPRFGLDSTAYEELARGVDLVIHAGAAVDFLRPYEALKEANVRGTEEVLRLACAERAKSLLYVSTLDVVIAAPRTADGSVSEDSDLDAVAALEGGYDQSKWVAERMVREAAERGLAARVVRLGRVTGDSATGDWGAEDFGVRLFLACIAMKCAPDLQQDLAAVPVDFAARAIAHLAISEPGATRTFHLTNGVRTTVRQVFEWTRARGFDLRLVPPAQWLEELARAKPPTLAPFLPLLAPGEASFLETPLPRFDDRHARAALEPAGLQTPPFDEALLDVYLGSFKRRGLL